MISLGAVDKTTPRSSQTTPVSSKWRPPAAASSISCLTLSSPDLRSQRSESISRPRSRLSSASRCLVSWTSPDVRISSCAKEATLSSSDAAGPGKIMALPIELPVEDPLPEPTAIGVSTPNLGNCLNHRTACCLRLGRPNSFRVSCSPLATVKTPATWRKSPLIRNLDSHLGSACQAKRAIATGINTATHTLRALYSSQPKTWRNQPTNLLNCPTILQCTQVSFSQSL